MYTLAILWMIIVIGKKKEEILNRDDEPLYVDDDEYWKLDSIITLLILKY